MGDTPQNMKAVQSSLRDEIVAQRQADDAAHAAILDKLHDYETEARVRNARDEEKAVAEKALRKQIFTLFLTFLSIIVGLVAWAAVEFRNIHRDVANNTAHFREFQAIGIEWGDNLDARDIEFKEDLRQLRRLVNEHQRNKTEHAHKE